MCVDRLLDGVDDADREDQREELGREVLVGRVDEGAVVGAARGGAGALVQAQLDAGLAQRHERARQELGGDVGVHEQRLRRVADARALDLGVDGDVAPPCRDRRSRRRRRGSCPRRRR